MKKWMLVSMCALGALVVGTLTAWGSDEEEDLGDEDTSGFEDTAGYEALIEEIEAECEATGCAEDGPITDEAIDEMGFDSLLIADAWGCCSLVQNGDGTATCKCTEPGPDPTKVVTETAIYVGKTGGMIYAYDTTACFGEKVSGAWSCSVCGGCRKDLGGLDHLLVYGNQSTALAKDIVAFIDFEGSAGNCYFTDWWSGAYYWDSVTADGRAGVDYIYGSPQGDELVGGSGNDYLMGYEDDDVLEGGSGDDHLYGGDDYDELIGGELLETNGDYCDCGADSDPAADECEGTIYNCND